MRKAKQSKAGCHRFFVDLMAVRDAIAFLSMVSFMVVGGWAKRKSLAFAEVLRYHPLEKG